MLWLILLFWKGFAQTCNPYLCEPYQICYGDCSYSCLSVQCTSGTPTQIYVDFTNSNSGRDGTQANPYQTLLEVFNSNTQQNIEILMKPGIHIIDYTLPSNTISDLSVAFISDCNPCTDLAIIKLQTVDFIFPDSNIANLYFENIIIDGEQAMDNSCSSISCGYCTYSLDASSLNSYISSCSAQDESSLINLIDIGSSGNLFMINSKFQNMRQDLKSLIFSTGGHILLYNTDFYNIKVYDSNSYMHGVITVECSSSSLCSDSLVYSGGSVSLLGNGYTYYGNIVQSSFLLAKFSGTLKISSISFSYNLALCGKNLLTASNNPFNCPSLIFILDCVEYITIENNIFFWNYVGEPIIEIIYDSNFVFNEKYVSNGNYLSYSNVYMYNNNFTENGSNRGIIDIYTFIIINAEIDNNYFMKNIIDEDNCKIINIWNENFSNDYNTWANEGGTLNVNGVDVQAEKNYIRVSNTYIDSCFASTMFHGKHVRNIHLFNMTILWNHPTYQSINAVVIDQFINQNYLSSAFNIFKDGGGVYYIIDCPFTYSASMELVFTKNIPEGASIYQLINIYSITKLVVLTDIEADSTNSIFSGLNSIYIANSVDLQQGELNISYLKLSNIKGNNASGTIYIYGLQSVTIKDSEITNVSQKSASVAWIDYFETLLISGVNIDNSISEDIAGCIYVDPSQLEDSSPEITIEDSVFNNCKGEYGGALYLDYRVQTKIKLAITNTVFSNGYSNDGGSAIFFVFGYPLNESSYIATTTFSDNYSSKTAALTLSYTGSLTISNCYFNKNSGEESSAIYGFFKDSNQPLNLIDSHFDNNQGKMVINIQSIISNCVITSSSCLFENHTNNTLISLDYVVWNDENSKFISCDMSFFAQSGSVVSLNGANFAKNAGIQFSIIQISYSSFSCESCIFEKNEKRCVSILGDSVDDFKNCLFVDNLTAYKGGAIIYSSVTGKSTISNCTFKNNYAHEGGVINIIESDVAIDDCIFEGNWAEHDSPGILLNTASLTVSNSAFKNQSTISSGAFISANTQSSVIVSKSSFYGGSAENGGSISLSGGTLSFTYSSFIYSDYSLCAAGIEATSNSSITIANSIFEDHRPEKIYDSNTYIIEIQGNLTVQDSYFLGMKSGTIYGYDANSVVIKNCNFSNGFNIDNGGAIYLQEVINGQIIGSLFVNNTSTDSGGAIYVQSSKTTGANFSITSCLFNNNLASYQKTGSSGGGIYISSAYMKINLTDNEFYYNTAENAGALLVSCPSSGANHNCVAYIEKNNFINNSALNSGGSIWWTGIMPKFENNEFKNNTAKYGNNMASFPIKFDILSVNNSRELVDFSNVPSGQKFPYTIKLGLLDHESQTVKYGYDSIQVTLIGSANVGVSGITQVNPVNGEIIFDEFYLTAAPGSEENLTISSPFISFSNGASIGMSINVSVSLRECIKGEYQQNNQCIECNNGTYSLDINDQCSNCPSNANCYGGYLIAPYSGYWHGSNDSAEIYECLNKGSCLGGLMSDNGYISTTGLCSVGYKGNLCQACKIGFSYSSSNVCAVCDYSWSVLKITLIIVGMTFALIILVYSTILSAYEPTSILSIHLKIFVNYIQLVSLAAQLRLSWPDMVSSFLDTQSKAGEISTQIFSIDCFLISEDDPDSYKTVYFTKLWIISLIPIILGLITFGFFCIVSSIKKNRNVMRKEFVATLCILFFLIHPSLTNYMFSAFSCMDIYGQKYLMKNLDIKCWDDTHSLYTVAIAVPSIVIWSIGIPCAVLWHLHRNRSRLGQIDFKIKFGFLYGGYKDSKFYWEFVIMTRKMSIILLSAVFNAISPNIQALTCLSVLIVFIHLQFIKRPFEYKDLNEMELRGSFVSAITIYCGLYYLTNTLDNASKWFFFIVMLLANILFWLVWIFKVFYGGLVSILGSWFKEIFKDKLLSFGKDKKEIIKKFSLINEEEMSRVTEAQRSAFKRPEEIYLKFLNKIQEKVIESDFTQIPFPENLKFLP